MVDGRHIEECPLAAVDRRLQDVHRQWHEAERAYFEPDGFRVAIQSAIQTLRTVTFILQSNKAAIPNFDDWYLGWQERFRADALMRWMVEARNKIEKQGDLEAHSFVRAEIVASYLAEGPAIEVPAKLFDGPQVLLEGIPRSNLGEHIRKSGTLRIRRRWVENTLPEYELLDAVAIAYGRIAELVHDAHRHLGLPVPVIVHEETGAEYPAGRGGRPPCMVGHEDARSLDFSLAEGARLEVSTESIPIDRGRAEEVSERYGVEPAEMFRSDGAEGFLADLFNTARKVTETDGAHVSLVFLLQEGKPVHMAMINPGDQAEKYLLMRKVAHEVTTYAADAVVIVGEMWRAKADPANPYMRAAEAADREEILAATLVRQSGDPVHLTAKFDRDGQRVRLGPTDEERGGAHFMFAPIYNAWNRPIPPEWMEIVGAGRVSPRP